MKTMSWSQKCTRSGKNSGSRNCCGAGYLLRFGYRADPACDIRIAARNARIAIPEFASGWPLIWETTVSPNWSEPVGQA